LELVDQVERSVRADDVDATTPVIGNVRPTRTSPMIPTEIELRKRWRVRG